MTDSIIRLTLDLDEVSKFEVFLKVKSLQSFGIKVFRVAQSPSKRGWHILSLVNLEQAPYQHMESSNSRLAVVRALREVFCDDRQRVELDDRRPSYARQVLFHKKSHTFL